MAFFGVAFFVAVAFFAAVFFGAAFFVAFGAAGALVLVTRPDLVLPRTRETSSSTAGAGAAVLRGLLALALGFAAAAAFLGAGFAAVVFFGAAFLVVVALAFCIRGQHKYTVDQITQRTVVVAFLGAAAFFSVVFFSTLGSAFLVVVVAAAGLASFLASFTVPEAPAGRVSTEHRVRNRYAGTRDAACQTLIITVFWVGGGTYPWVV